MTTKQYIEKLVNEWQPMPLEEMGIDTDLIEMKRNLLRAQLERLVIMAEGDGINELKSSFLKEVTTGL